MINLSQPDTIDERVINTKKLTTFKMTVSALAPSDRPTKCGAVENILLKACHNRSMLGFFVVIVVGSPTRI